MLLVVSVILYIINSDEVLEVCGLLPVVSDTLLVSVEVPGVMV